MTGTKPKHRTDLEQTLRPEIEPSAATAGRKALARKQASASF